MYSISKWSTSYSKWFPEMLFLQKNFYYNSECGQKNFLIIYLQQNLVLKNILYRQAHLLIYE
jgi:hypothetical protein